MLFDETYNYELITKDFYDLKYFSVKNIGKRIKRRIITFYDVDGEIITSRRSINRTKLSKEVDLTNARVITKYYLEETEGDYSDDSYENMRYFNIVNLGYFRSYEKVLDDAKVINDSEEIKKMINEYDKNFMNFEEIDDEKFINSKRKL